MDSARRDVHRRAPSPLRRRPRRSSLDGRWPPRAEHAVGFLSAHLTRNPRGAPPPQPSPASGRGTRARRLVNGMSTKRMCLASWPLLNSDRSANTDAPPLPLAGEDWGGGASAYSLVASLNEEFRSKKESPAWNMPLTISRLAIATSCWQDSSCRGRSPG